MTNLGVYSSVCEIIEKSKIAYKSYREFGLANREKIIENIRKTLSNYADKLAEMSFSEINMGKLDDKKEKIRLSIEKTPGTEDLVSEVYTKDRVMTLYEYSPYGVSAALLPSTNPVATVINNVIGMIAAGNSVVLCPHPRAIEVTKFLTGLLNKIIIESSGIENLVTCLDDLSIKNINELMNHPELDLLVVTGGSYIAKEAYKCNKKVISAGPANPTFIVDETADIDDAARKIVKGASFDNNILCVTEKNIVVVDAIYEKLKKSLISQGCFYIDNVVDMLKLTKVVLTEDFKINKFFGGKSVGEILNYAGIKNDGDYKLIAVDLPKIHPLATEEQLMPILSVIRESDFDEALNTAILLEQGLYHTAGIHSNSIRRMNIAAKELKTCIFVKNGSSLDGIGFSDDNPVSFTIANKTGEGSTSTRNFAIKRRCVLVDGFSIR
ncbi:aldehyde dehydrogenase (NAD) family protein [Anaerococcus hydrogenalis DSM 7454]|uniref:Aldehyde dehydrogenase (NAD) family protein n=1 Tax=Anaerococcus hydrogenalis DSM 7454 TaxID=561177 RepID=B6W8K4_9FIRM|nr:aldehyde dehydrogenase [Anaerococcus hydrogenalis]EEB36275.1 aldehyde dehydrogenase (NAD) family protein [Anaerococcus hydrogenalis DSM 7454]